MTAPEDQNGLREALARAVEAGASNGRTTTEIVDDLFVAGSPLASLIAERFKWQELAALHEELKDAAIREGATWRLRALAAEAEITRLKEGMEALRAKAEGQIAYWRERQAAEKSLEDGVSEDGLTYMPMGDHAAWQAGYCNGRMSEADWWRWTLKVPATLSPKEQP